MSTKLFRGFLVTTALLTAASQLAWGANITVYDRVSSAATGWYGPQEDDEVEPGCITSQAWDLESFELTGTTLRLTGGWNFQGGFDRNGSGDIFIDVNGDAVWGQDVYALAGDGNRPTSNNLYGYDYVIHFSDRSGTTIGAGGYEVLQLDSSSQVAFTTPYFRQNDASSPWIYVDGGTSVESAQADFGSFGDHYTMDVDVGFLGDASDVLFKFTLQCGNDNLVGRGTVNVPDGGLTSILLGVALMAVAGLKRRLMR